MKKILFRGKTDERRSRWAYGSLIIAGDYSCILESEDKIHPMDYPYLDKDLGTIDGYATPVTPETVGQFTGLLDEIGAEIFEGDIVEIESNGYIPDKNRGVVVFKNGCYGINYVSDWDLEHAYNDVVFHRIGKIDHWQDMGAGGEITYTYELLGNVYDHPNLLGDAYDILMSKYAEDDEAWDLHKKLETVGHCLVAGFVDGIKGEKGEEK